MSSLGSNSNLDIDPSIKRMTLEEIAEGQCAEWTYSGRWFSQRLDISYIIVFYANAD